MKRNYCIPLMMVGLLIAATGSCVAQTEVTGVVMDSKGKPIAGVACLLAGTPSLTPGQRVIYSGIAQPIYTDKEGKFTVPLAPSIPLADLQFDGGGFAPVFLYRVGASASPLRVVMTEGKLLKGRIVDEKQMPVANAEIELQLPQEDRWYQRKEVTNAQGEFEFRISEPAQNFSWLLYFAGKRFKIDYSQITPSTSITLTAEVRISSL